MSQISRLIVMSCLVLAAACGGCDDGTAGSGATANNVATNANPNNAANSGTNSPFEQNTAGQVLCNGEACACDDGVDGDGDVKDAPPTAADLALEDAWRAALPDVSAWRDEYIARRFPPEPPSRLAETVNGDVLRATEGSG